MQLSQLWKAAMLSLSLLSLHAAAAIIAPNTSLATTPTGYFGGNAARRDNASIAMLAKNRIVMIEKWEGRCWQECLAGGVGSWARVFVRRTGLSCLAAIHHK